MASTLGFGGLQSPGLAVAKAYAQPQAPRVVRIAHLSRRQGPDAEMAAYAIMGAQLGAEEADVTAGMFGTRVELIIEDAVTPENVESLTAKLGAQAHLSAIVAALDERTAARVSDATQQQRLVCSNAAARGGVLRGEKCHRLTFHVEPDLAMYTHAMGQWLVHNNRKRWHFVVAESAAEQEVYQRAGRFLQHQGGNDLGRSVITRDSRIIKPCLRSWRVRRPRLSWWHSEARAYGSFWSSTRHRASTFFWRGSARYDRPLAGWSASPQGVWVTSWYHQLERFSARELNRRFLRRFERPAEGFAWANWAAVKLVVEGVLRSASTDAVALVNYLEGAPQFDGHKGKALTFPGLGSPVAPAPLCAQNAGVTT